MCVGALELRQLGHADRNLRDAQTALRQQPVRRQPRRSGPLLDIFPERDIDRVVVLVGRTTEETMF